MSVRPDGAHGSRAASDGYQLHCSASSDDDFQLNVETRHPGASLRGYIEPARHSILWIEDDEHLLKIGVEMLSRAGFRLETAATGPAGLARACSKDYDLIILNWALPILDGGQVLRELRAAGLQARIMVCSIHPSAQDAAESAGATYFHLKPVHPKFVEVVKGLLELESNSWAGSTSDGPPPGWVIDICDEVDQVANAALDSAQIAVRLQATVLNLAREKHRTIGEFWVCAGILKLLAAASGHVAAEVRSLVTKPVISRAQLHPRTLMAVDRFEAAGRDVRFLKEQGVAAELAVDRAHFGRTLRADTGLSFHEWTLGARIRGAARELGDDLRHVAEIGGRWGWSSPSQFSRQFRATCGLTPREFRRLMQACQAHTRRRTF